MSYAFCGSLKTRIQDHLAEHALLHWEEPSTQREDAPRNAAVSIVILPHPDTGEAAFWLTRRASKLRRHSGQFALPGGRIDVGETPAQAALREISEEMGVVIAPAAILGQLDDFVTRSGFCITPFVIWLEGAFTLTPCPDEVAKVFHIPLSDLDNPDIPKLRPSDTPGRHIMSAPLATMGHEIYAPTAALLYQFREIGLHGRETRVGHFDQPQFARQ